MPKSPDLTSLLNVFQAVAKTLETHREELNQTDAFNHDHGDNMVQVFKVVAQAIGEKKNSDPAIQLAHASQVLNKQKSGSAQAYAKGFQRASQELKGQKHITPENALKLIQSLMGAGNATAPRQAQSGTEDLLGSLLGADNNPTGQNTSRAGDLLESILGNAGNAGTGPRGRDSTANPAVNELINAGLTFMNSKSQGSSNKQALVNALVLGSAIGNSTHRTQSSTLVVNSMLQALGALTAKK